MSAPDGAQGAKPANNPFPHLIKPAQVENLPFLAHDIPQKQKMFSAVSQCWSILNTPNIPHDSPQYKSALDNLNKISNSVRSRLTQWRETNPPAAGGQRPQSQGQAQMQQPQQPAPQGEAQMPPAQNAPQKPQPTSSIPPPILKHVNEFQYVNPKDKPRGTPEGEQWVKSTREQYLNLLVKMERYKSNISQLDKVVEQYRQQGKPTPPEAINKKNEFQKEWETANAQVQKFRTQQSNALQQQNSQQSQSQNTAQPIKTEGGMQPSGTQNINMQLPGQQQSAPQQPVQRPQPPSAPVNPAVANAQNQNRPAMSPAMTQPPTSFAQPQTPNQAVPHPPPSATATRPPLNTQLQPPQSAYPNAESTQNPQTLSQQEAIAQAQRSYSDRQTPQSTVGQYGPQVGSREPPTSGSKFPIPKTLPDRAIAPPAPVAMTTPRPTLSGPANGLGGMIGQVPIEKQAGVIMLDGGDGGIVSRKKLQELLREVGGPDEIMTPQVEDLLLGIADEFVDNLTLASARVAKVRGGQDLQIRDLQMVLERQYNIRIPGYSADETRVVRKVQPTQGWLSKLNAVQAAKVMGNKMDI